MYGDLVSVIIPVFNEEKYIRKCIDSIISQDYSLKSMEVLFIDGGSIDKTVDIINSYNNEKFRIINNPNRIVTYALNLGILNSKGKYIVRMDAHAAYEDNYISCLIKTLDSVGADNVGGVAITKGLSKVGMANADILSSKFGVGNSQFRTSSKSGYVDTVPFGVFRRDIFDTIGLFNVELPRSEDNDINSRIRKKGGKVYLNADVKFTYYCRDSFGGVLNQALMNGNALFLTLKKNPRAMSVRHFIPFCFLMSLIVLPIFSFLHYIFAILFLTEMVVYFGLDFAFSIRGNSKKLLYKFFTYPLFHISYGVGSLIGLFGVRLY